MSHHEAARTLGVSPSTISRWAHSGRFQVAQPSSRDRSLAVPVDAIREALLRHPRGQEARSGRLAVGPVKRDAADISPRSLPTTAVLIPLLDEYRWLVQGLGRRLTPEASSFLDSGEFL